MESTTSLSRARKASTRVKAIDPRGASPLQANVTSLKSKRELRFREESLRLSPERSSPPAFSRSRSLVGNPPAGPSSSLRRSLEGELGDAGRARRRGACQEASHQVRSVRCRRLAPGRTHRRPGSDPSPRVTRSLLPEFHPKWLCESRADRSNLQKTPAARRVSCGGRVVMGRKLRVLQAMALCGGEAGAERMPGAGKNASPRQTLGTLRLGHLEQRLAAFHDGTTDRVRMTLILIREVVHDVQHELFHNGT